MREKEKQNDCGRRKKWKSGCMEKEKKKEDRKGDRAREMERAVPYALHCAQYFWVEGEKDFKW